MKPRKNNKKSGPEVVREEYLKKMNSPIYRKEMKRTMNMLINYNDTCRGKALTKADLRKIARFFVDKIAPNTHINIQSEVDNSDSLPLKPLKI